MKFRVCFDNSSLCHMYLSRKKIQLERIFDKFDIYLSVLNISELIVYKNIENRNELLRFYDKINYQNNNPLDFPNFLLKKAYLAHSSGKENLIASNDRDSGRTFLRYLKKPDDISQQNVLKTEKYLRKNKEIFISPSKAARDDPRIKNMFKNKIEPKNLSEFLELTLENDDLVTSFVERMVLSFGINDFNKKNGIAIFKEITPWLFYLSALFGGFYNWGFRRGCNPNPDYIDVSQAIYLSFCDYFITDDNALKNLLNEVIVFIESYLSYNLKKKVLKFDEFLSECEV